MKLDEYARNHAPETVRKLEETKNDTETALVELAELVSEGEATNADIMDALIELGNIVGGNSNG